MPQMGVSVAEGTIVAWRVEVGDPIQADQTICEISTDKIDTEVPSPASGVVAEIVVPVESTVEVGTVLARIDTGGGGDGSGSTAAPDSSAENGAGGDAGGAPGPATETSPAEPTTASASARPDAPGFSGSDEDAATA